MQAAQAADAVAELVPVYCCSPCVGAAALFCSVSGHLASDPIVRLQVLEGSSIIASGSAMYHSVYELYLFQFMQPKCFEVLRAHSQSQSFLMQLTSCCKANIVYHGWLAMHVMHASHGYYLTTRTTRTLLLQFTCMTVLGAGA